MRAREHHVNAESDPKSASVADSSQLLLKSRVCSCVVGVSMPGGSDRSRFPDIFSRWRAGHPSSRRSGRPSVSSRFPDRSRDCNDVKLLNALG